MRVTGRLRRDQLFSSASVSVSSGFSGTGSAAESSMPTRLELVWSALAEAEGRVTVEAVLARIEARYAEQPSRGSLIRLAMNVGASVDGKWITRKALTSTSSSS